jgi:D-alanyl-D-alanine carboxypeptidase (penicillin-binding protein 5/6)
MPRAHFGTPSGWVRRSVLGVVVAAVAVSLGAASAGSADAAVTPKPTPSVTTKTLPVPKATVDPLLSVGGPRLASMGVVTDLPAGVPPPPRLKDVAWVLADLDTGTVIAAKAAHARLLPASTLKTLTALTLIPKVPASTRIVATQADANADGTRVGIVPGLPYTAHELFQALLMSSGNDAAYALAEAGGGREATLAAMNEQAAYLGAHDTVAKDPSGLDAPGQTSSAYDLALIGRAALQLSDFRGYVTTKEVDFPGRVDPKTKKRQAYEITNHNKLLYNYDGTIGVKNGYTEAANRTFISAVTRGGRTYLLTEMYGLDSSWRPQAAMYDWAFAYGARAGSVGELVAPGTVTTAPTALPSTAAPTLTDPAAAGRATGLATRAAAAIPASAKFPLPSSPWLGLAGVAAALLLVALLAARARRRPARATRGRHR